MGDALSWAADREEERRRNSQSYKENELRCKRWNYIFETLFELSVTQLKVKDLFFLGQCKAKVDPVYHHVSKSDLKILEDIYARCF